MCVGFSGLADFVCLCLFWALCGDVLGCRVTSIMTDTVLSRPLRADMPGHSDFPSVMIAEMGVLSSRCVLALCCVFVWCTFVESFSGFYDPDDDRPLG